MTTPTADETKHGLKPGAWWPDALIVLALGFLCISFFWFIITPNAADRGSFPAGDFDAQFFAFGAFEARELSAGRLPLWCPFYYAGHPFQADVQSAIFYPPSLLTLLLSALWGFSLLALEWEAITHFFLASVFTYLFARRLTRSRGAALVAAVVFAYGGYLTSYPSQQLAVLEVGIWLPLLLWLLDIGFERMAAANRGPGLATSIAPFVAGGLAWGVSLLAGHPQTSMYVFYMCAAYSVFAAWRYAVRWDRAMVGLVLVQVLGLALAAVQFIPGLEYMRLSTRASVSYSEVAGGLARQDVLQLLLPGLVSEMSPLYVGVMPLLLAVLAPLLRRSAQAAFWVGTAIVSLLLSFGGNTFVFSLFYLAVPGFALFRSQERAAFLFSFALALLAGLGVACLLRPLPRNLKRRLRDFSSATGYLLAGALLFVALAFYGWLRAGWSADSPFGPALTRAVLLALLLFMSWVLFTVRVWRRVRPRTLAILLTVLIVFDLFTVNWRNNLSDLKPEDHWQATPLVGLPMQDGDVFRLYNEYQVPGNYGCVYNLEETLGASPLRLRTYDDLLRAVPIERAWELLNVKYVLTWRKTLPAESDRLYEEQKGKEMSYLHRLEQIGPRAWAVYEAEHVDDNTALNRLADPAFDPFARAVVSDPLPFPLAGGKQPPASIEFVERLPGRMAVDATLPADGLLVLSEVYFPGWTARVDGQESPIHRVQHTLRGIPLRAGAHRIEMEFRPRTFVVGAVVSALTLVSAFAALVVLRRRRT